MHGVSLVGTFSNLGPKNAFLGAWDRTSGRNRRQIPEKMSKQCVGEKGSFSDHFGVRFGTFDNFPNVSVFIAFSHYFVTMI